MRHSSGPVGPGHWGEDQLLSGWGAPGGRVERGSLGAVIMNHKAWSRDVRAACSHKLCVNWQRLRGRLTGGGHSLN